MAARASARIALVVPALLVALAFSFALDNPKPRRGAACGFDYRLNLDGADGFSFELPVLGRVRVPASLKGTIPVIRVPRVRAAGLKVEQLTLTAASLVLSLEIRNPNSFSLGLEAMECTLDVGGKRWAAGRAAKADAIEPCSVGRLYLPITLNLLSAGRTVAEALAKRGPVSCVLDGRAAVTTPLPLLKSAVVPFHLEGQTEIAR